MYIKDTTGHPQRKAAPRGRDMSTGRGCDTLRMPDHTVPSANPDGGDFYLHGSPIICRSTKVPGYAHQNPDGRLHCNRCGWVTPEPVITAYCDTTGNTYLTWDELVEKESNGYVVVTTSERPGTVPVVNGSYPDRRTARNAQVRLRREGQRHERSYRLRTYVRVLWP